MEPDVAPSPPRRRGRPPNPDLARRRRAEIVEAAFDVFIAHGYHAASLDEVARVAGIGKGTIYKYYDGKRELFDAVVDLGVTRFTALMQEGEAVGQARTADELEQQLSRISTRMLGVLDDHPQLVRLLVIETTSVDERLMQRMLDVLDVFASLLAAYIADGVERGFLAADLDVELAARALLSGFAAGMILTLTGGPDDPDRGRRVAALLVSYTVEGVGAEVAA